MARPNFRRLEPAGEARRLERRAAALVAMADWPGGLPPLAVMGYDSGVLFGLARDGLALKLPRDRVGDHRFVLTEAGRQQLEASR